MGKPFECDECGSVTPAKYRRKDKESNDLCAWCHEHVHNPEPVRSRCCQAAIPEGFKCPCQFTAEELDEINDACNELDAMEDENDEDSP